MACLNSSKHYTYVPPSIHRLFLDTIKDINVGMEGHGAWRSHQTACEPGVYYQRGDLLCICTEDGGWPNSICRDTFRILHPVLVVTDSQSFKTQQCDPGNLYLIGCNVCFCPADGVPNPKFCTKKSCNKDDPVLKTPKEQPLTPEVADVFVQCEPDSKYKLGCKNCFCLKNNRLVCDNCTSTNMETICSYREPGEMFNKDCNICQCDKNGLVYCTVKRCLKNKVISRENVIQTEFEEVETPVNDINCIPGTRYKRDCNNCYCFQRFGVKKYGCTLENCSKTVFHTDCVEGTMYKMDCLICQCGNYNGRKMQVCQEDPKCKKPADVELMQLTALNGYCEPLQLYKDDCNTCKCLPDGKTARCTANICQRHPNVENEYTPKPIPVEIVPIVKNIGACEKGSTFKIDCNKCFCLMNGDVVCTTEDCR